MFFVIWEEASGRRQLGEGIWEETSYKASGRRHLGGGVWRRQLRRGISEDSGMGSGRGSERWEGSGRALG